MKLTSKSGATLAAAAATLFLAGATLTTVAQAAGEGHCVGANACKGQSACKGGNHACKGQNACKGQGFAAMTKGGLASAGMAEQLGTVSLDLDFDKAFPTDRVGAYERLLLDAIAGRLNLFVRSDEQEQAWRWVGTILDALANDSEPPRSYASGSWGPAAASSLIARDGFAWAEEE